MHGTVRTLGLLAALAGAALAFDADGARAGVVTISCGATFAGKGQLAADCAGTVTIERGTLYLEGHTITSTGLTGIDCLNSCKIIGPGRIVGGGASFGVLSEGRIQLYDIDEISGHSISGVRGGERGGLRVDNSHISANGTGLTGARVKITASTVTDNATDGLLATNRGVKLIDCDIRGNGRDGVGALLDNAEPRRVVAVDTHIEENSEFGIIARNIRLKRSHVEDNASAVECYDTIACADIASIRKPKKDFMSACGRSMQIPEVFTGPVPIGDDWTACYLDAFPP